MGKKLELPRARATELAREIVADLDLDQKMALMSWAQELVAIRSADVSLPRRAAAAVKASMRRETVAVLLKRIQGSATKAGVRAKVLLWDNRNWATRVALGGVGAGLAVGGAEAGAGIAALGSAIGVPLWLVTASGGAFLGALIDELAPMMPKGRTPDFEEVDWLEVEQLLEGSDLEQALPPGLEDE